MTSWYDVSFEFKSDDLNSRSLTEEHRAAASPFLLGSPAGGGLMHSALSSHSLLSSHCGEGRKGCVVVGEGRVLMGLSLRWSLSAVSWIGSIILCHWVMVIGLLFLPAVHVWFPSPSLISFPFCSTSICWSVASSWLWMNPFPGSPQSSMYLSP